MYKQKLELDKYEKLDKELKTLYELGVPDYEIDYIKHLRTKQEASRKWG
jgi:uncharacterized short protein YbdD (DUF466 family)